MRFTFPILVAALTTAVPLAAAEIVPAPQFNSVELRGGGAVTVVPGPAQRVTIVEGSSQFTQIRVERDGQLKIDTCHERCPLSYRLRIEIQSPHVPGLAVDGGGVIVTADGFASQPHLATAVNGGGRVDTRSVDAQSVSAAVSGGGELLVRPREALKAAVNGGGHIRFLGKPTVTSAVRGGGSVSQAN